MKLETVHLILLLSVLSLLLSILVNWHNYSGDQNQDNKFILPIILSVLTCHQKFSDYNLLRNIVFGSVLLLQPKGALSDNNHETNDNEARNVMQRRNNFGRQPMISLAKKYVRPKPKSLNNNNKVPNKSVSATTKRRSLRPQLTKKKSTISRKEELSNRILEEIEALDPLKCLPKALCSLSAQSTDTITDSNSYDSRLGQTEQKRKNNNVVNEYLDLMQTIITMEPKRKREEKKRKFASTQLERPPSSSSSRNDDDDDENEENSEEDEEDNEEESQEEETQHSQRTSYGHGTQMNKFDKDFHLERHKIKAMLATTESPDEWGNLDVLDHPFPYPHDDSDSKPSPQRNRPGQSQKMRHGMNGNRKDRRKPEHSGYSQQYHYVSAPGPPGYHVYQGPSYHEPVDDSVSFTSILYNFIPHWLKKIIDIFIPSFTFEYKPLFTTPSSIFAEDPFFDGFKKRNGWPSNGHEEEEDRSFHAHNKMRSRARSMNDLMVDARERFAGAIEIGETFRNLRKCDAVYSTCPFQHTEIVNMIDVLKKKLKIQDIVDRRIANLEKKKSTNTKNKDEDFTEESQSQTKEKQSSTSVLTRRKSQISENSHNAYTRDSLSFSHDKNFKRKPLVIRNINKILRPGLPSQDQLSNKIQHRLTLQIPSTNARDKTANVNKQGNGKSEIFSDLLSAEYYESRESEEDLFAVANSNKPQRKKYTITKSKITDDIKNSNKNKPTTTTSSTTTDSPSLFQSIFSFF